jgi:signal transduction histidine kinase
VTYFQGTDIECRLDLPGDVPAVGLSARLRDNLLHAMEEALSNVLRHSHATTVVISMQIHGGLLRLTIEDNGKWFERPDEYRGGDGLSNMRQRMSDIGGECTVENTVDRGTLVRLDVGLPSKSVTP